MKRILLIGSLMALAGAVWGDHSALAQQGMRRSLPPVVMDSFVREAGGHAEHIYGDEGANGLPPYLGSGARLVLLN